MIQLHLVHDPNALAGIESEWYELLADSDANEPTLTPIWLMAWWRVFGCDGARSLCACVVREGGRLVGLIPLQARRHRYRRVIPFRRLELLASGEDAADEILSDYIGLIVARGREAVVADTVVDAIVTGRLGEWDELVCPRVLGTRDSVAEFIRALTERGLAVAHHPTTESFHIVLPTTWDAYLDALPSNHRYMVRRALRELDKWAGKDQKVETVTNGGELARGSEILRSLHGERWSAQGHRGVFASSRFSQFHDLVMPQLLARDALQLVWLTVKGSPVGVLYNIVWNGKVYFYQSGRKLDVPKNVRPGIALQALVIRDAIERGRCEYDFLGGDAQYKAQLATHTRSLIELRATPRRSLREGTRLLAERVIKTWQTARSQVRGADASGAGASTEGAGK